MYLTLQGHSFGNVVHLVIPIIDEESSYQMVMFPMSHLLVGTSSDERGPLDKYDLVDTVVPIYLRKGQICFFLSSVAHGGGAANQECNLSLYKKKHFFGPIKKDVARIIESEEYSDMSLHFDLVDKSVSVSGHRAAEISVEGIKQFGLDFMEKSDMNRLENVRKIMDKISRNQRCLSDCMERKLSSKPWLESAYRFEEGLPAFLYHTRQEIDTICECLHLRPSSEMLQIMACPSVSEALSNLRNDGPILISNKVRRSNRFRSS